ncbi:MAG: hypothetical protein KUG59_04000 [Parvibaculaceae bacterium]|nr:hypothetical protein [Parvibaculaceae bacterium]
MMYYFSEQSRGVDFRIEHLMRTVVLMLLVSAFVAACAGPPKTRKERVERYIPLPTAEQLEARVTDPMPTTPNWKKRLSDYVESQRPGIDNFEWWEPVKGSFRTVRYTGARHVRITEYTGWYGCGVARYANVSARHKRREVPVAGVFSENKLLAKLYWDEEASEVCRMLPGFIVASGKEYFPETAFDTRGDVPALVDDAATDVSFNSDYRHGGFDLSNTQMEVMDKFQLQRELCNWDIVTTKTGRLELCESNNRSVSFAMQSINNFKRGMRTRDLFGIEGRDDPSIHRRLFSTGPGLYSEVTVKGQNCVAFMINTGAKSMVNGRKPATRSIFAGLHCGQAHVGEDVKPLLRDVDKIRIIR